MRAQDRSKWRQLAETAMLTGWARHSMMMIISFSHFRGDLFNCRCCYIRQDYVFTFVLFVFRITRKLHYGFEEQNRQKGGS